MERRKKNDIWAKALFYLNITAWVLLFLLFFVFHRAQPEYETFFDRFYHLKLRTHWDIQYLAYLMQALMVSIFVCILGLLLSRYRGRRKTDHNPALILTGIISLLMLSVALNVV